MQTRNVLAASLVALLVGGPVFSQAAIVGIDDLDERIDDIQDDVQEDLAEAEDAARFGPNNVPQGWAGSFALGLSTTSGNTDTGDLSLGGRFRYGAGPWNHTFGFAAELGEDNGIRNKEEFVATYDVNRFLTDTFYVFGLGSFSYNNFSSNEIDAFLGFGPGYRILNTDQVAWRVQAGPGVRYIEDQTGADTTELAGIVASRFYYKITETVFLTNDTDVIFSEDSTAATNDLGVNLAVTDSISTRVSYRTEYDSDPLPGLQKTDNTFRVSLVYGF